MQQAALSSSVLDLSQKPAPTPHDQVLAIEVDSLMKAYRTRGVEHIIYENVSFAARPGEVTLIMGSSGSGKSTLLRQIALLDPVATGRVCYFGDDVAGRSISAKAKIRAKQLGFIFQSYALIKEFSVLENCALPLLMNGFSKSAALAKARDYISNFISDISADKQPDELSGGEQQRVAIIRALIHQPGIVIADEPTGNLDSKNAEIIKQELVRIARQLGSAVIIVSHDEGFIDCSDAFYILEPCIQSRVKSQLVRIK